METQAQEYRCIEMFNAHSTPTKNKSNFLDEGYKTEKEQTLLEKQNIKEEGCLIHFIINNIFRLCAKCFTSNILHDITITLFSGKKEIIVWLGFEPRSNFDT